MRCVYLTSSSHVLKDALQEKEWNFYLELVHSEQVQNNFVKFQQLPTTSITGESNKFWDYVINQFFVDCIRNSLVVNNHRTSVEINTDSIGFIIWWLAEVSS